VSLTRLKVFCTVARCGSFTQAALQLAMTQPAISFQIKQLESELRAQLIERKGRGLALTPAGEVARDHAERILALESEMKQRVAAFVSGGPK